MITFVRINHGIYSGQHGWISGSLEDRKHFGLTKAIVHLYPLHEHEYENPQAGKITLKHLIELDEISRKSAVLLGLCK